MVEAAGVFRPYGNRQASTAVEVEASRPRLHFGHLVASAPAAGHRRLQSVNAGQAFTPALKEELQRWVTKYIVKESGSQMLRS